MSDTYRRYAAVQRSLSQFFPSSSGHRERHLHTLCALICGLSGGQHAHLPAIADHAPTNGADQASLITRFRRSLKNETMTIKGFFLPVAKASLANLAQRPLTLVIDGRAVGRGCVALMVSVVDQGRALPLIWLVVKGKKGRCPRQTHRALLALLQELIPRGADVRVRGDGASDGTDLQAERRTLT